MVQKDKKIQRNNFSWDQVIIGFGLYVGFILIDKNVKSHQLYHLKQMGFCL